MGRFVLRRGGIVKDRSGGRRRLCAFEKAEGCKHVPRVVCSAILLILAVALFYGCRGDLSRESIDRLVSDHGNVPSVSMDGQGTPEIDVGKALSNMTGEFGEIYLAVHPFVLPVVITVWIIMFIRVIYLHTSKSKLKRSVVGFGIAIPLAVVLVDIMCGVMLSWAEAGIDGYQGRNLIPLIAQGIDSCAPVLAVMAVFVLALGVSYLFLGQKRRSAWRSITFAILIDLVLCLLIVVGRIMGG